ncbi:hypothetical protein ACI2IX_02050 [Leifsonia aquatica]|uniref:hypothetical protein n=1 Tax=Leifsonia aquatica TaxID=144185 RepID=UPI0038500ADA
MFVDANVLVPGRWRDIVLTLAEADLFEILWSPLVLEEVDRHLPAGMDAEARDYFGRHGWPTGVLGP